MVKKQGYTEVKLGDKIFLVGTGKDIIEASLSKARKIEAGLLKKGYKVRVFPFYEDGVRLYHVHAWKVKK